MSDDLIQRLRNASAAAVFLDVPDEDSPNHPRQLFAQAAATIARLTRERDEARAGAQRKDFYAAKALAAEAREAKLREALAKVYPSGILAGTADDVEAWQREVRAVLAETGGGIIRGVKGELYPCKPDIFAATYEPVNDDAP